MTEWKVGMKAVCIDDRHWPKGPVKNNTYTVSVVEPHPEFGHVCLVLSEMGPLFGWNAERFRPAVEPSIKVFEDILAKLPKEIERVLTWDE